MKTISALFVIMALLFVSVPAIHAQQPQSHSVESLKEQIRTRGG